MKKSQFLLFLLFSTCYAQYDLIFVGMGTSSSIVLTKLVQSFPQKKFLAVELGGPTAAQIGGNDFPSYMPSGTPNRVTITDIPGEYPNIAFQSQGEKYKIEATDFTWQGSAFGGNSEFNGMMYQEPPNDYLDSLPAGWRSGDLRPYFNNVRSKMTITTTPSKDGKTYLGGVHDVLTSLYQTQGWTQKDMSNLGPLGNPGYYSRPWVASNGNGQRGGPVSGYLSTIIGSNGQPSKSNLVIVRNAEVKKILFSSSETRNATGVSYLVSGASNAVTATLNVGGRIVLGGGALMTPRLLYLSGVGPAGAEDEVFDNRNGINFVRNNPQVGAKVFDHVGAPLNFQYTGSKPVQFLDYTNPGANKGVTDTYRTSRTGPYAQYGPVSIAHGRSDTSKAHPNFELFVNPFVAGQSNTFQMVSMLFRTRSNARLGLDFIQNIRSPGIYYSDGNDATDQTNAVMLTINQILSKDSGIKITKGPSNPSSFSNVKSYVTSNAFIMNHFTGTVPLATGSETTGGVDPTTTRLRSTNNVHVVDASILPGTVPSHPVAVIMAIGEKSADLIGNLLRASSTSSTSTRTSTSSTRSSSSSTTPTGTGSTIPFYLSYTFGSVSNGGISDVSGNGRRATLIGSPTIVAGKVGNGIKFLQTGGVQALQVTNGNTLSTTFSIAFWLNKGTVSNLAKLASSKTKWDDANGWQLELDSPKNSLNFVAGGSSTAKFEGVNIPTNQWIYVVVVVNNLQASLYLNANFVATKAITSVKAGTAPLYIATNNRGTGNEFTGIMDEFKITTSALTQTQINQLYSGQAAAPGSFVVTETPETSPSSSSGPARCGGGTCPEGEMCCNGQCYSPSVYVCTIDNKGKVVLCPVGNGSCNGGCYSTSMYRCTDDGLVLR